MAQGLQLIKGYQEEAQRTATRQYHDRILDPSLLKFSPAAKIADHRGHIHGDCDRSRDAYPLPGDFLPGCFYGTPAAAG